MSRKLLVLNGLFLAIAALAAASIARQLLTPRPLSGPGKAPAVATSAAPQAESPPAPAAAYAVVAARNLFSPTRTETGGEAAGPAPIVAKPNLFGVVLREGKPSIAYLEDPLSRRVNPYRIGDPVSGGTLQSITRDSVTIERPDGKFSVALRDPAKPRPAPTTAVVPGAVGTPAITPGVLPGAAPRPPVTVTPTPSQPPGLIPRAQITPPPQEPASAETPGAQGRRLPFNFLRRLPPTTSGQPPGATQPTPAPSAPPQGKQD